jgi:hypothetical protein
MKEIQVGNKICDFPIKLKGWVVKAGDSLYITERNIPDSQYTIVSITDRSRPRFVGYGALTDDHLKKSADTLNKSFYSGFPYYTPFLPSENGLLFCTNDTLIQYSVHSGKFQKDTTVILRDSLAKIYSLKGIYPAFDRNRFILWCYDFRRPYVYRFMMFGSKSPLSISEGATLFNDCYGGKAPGLKHISFYNDMVVAAYELYFDQVYRSSCPARYEIFDFSRSTAQPKYFINTMPSSTSTYPEAYYSSGMFDKQYTNATRTLDANKQVYGGYIFKGTIPNFFNYALVDSINGEVIFVYNDSFSIHSTKPVSTWNPVLKKEPGTGNCIRVRSEKGITVMLKKSVTEITIYDICGRLVYASYNLYSGPAVFHVNVPGGLYIIKTRKINGQLNMQRMMTR